MPEIDFDPQHKKATSEALEFDRLKLKKDEKARIVLLEKPTFAYVHTLRAPKIVNGVAQKIEKESRKGGTYVDFDMDFVGRPLCLGDYGIIATDGFDKANCPACKRSAESDEVAPPERRFAMNIIRYAMTRDGSKPITPFACSCLVWTFTDRMYNTLVDIAQEGGLQGRDLLLKCTNEPFQNYDVLGGSQNLWQSSDAIKATVTETYQANRVEELERACGRKAQTAWLVKDLDAIAERWRVARGEKDGTETVGGAALNDGLADLLGGNTKTAGPDEKAVDMADLLGGNGVLDAEPKASAISSAKPAAGSSFNFDDVLDGL